MKAEGGRRKAEGSYAGMAGMAVFILHPSSFILS
jgi:hypothetical protein